MLRVLGGCSKSFSGYCTPRDGESFCWTSGLAILPEIDDAIILTSSTWKAQYLGLSEPVTTDEHQESLAYIKTGCCRLGGKKDRRMNAGLPRRT
ncbi:hypothetical protein LR032_06485 [Candidatus Bipolaricaulota bacterium]|nr:hypothetical protein [Candidatus Bipolaricaulota bacterium]